MNSVEFVKVNDKYICIYYDDYTPNIYSLILVDDYDSTSYHNYLMTKRGILGEYSVTLKTFVKFDEEKSFIINKKLDILLKQVFIKYENVKQVINTKINDFTKTDDFTKVYNTINFLETLLEDVKENDQLFKKIGDFIKYLEE